jgi:16S rRNA G966 N2-methylase RsmD
VAITRISDLTPDRRNARKRTERSAGMIAKSLEKFGAARSVVIDENGQLLAGHGTIEAAAQVGIENVLVVPADGNTVVAVQRSNLTPDQKVQYALADNRSSDLSEWDAEVLSELADEHDLQDWFQQDELDDILGQVQELDSEEGLTDPDEVPEPPAEPVTKPGDVWLLGGHRVMCGDSTVLGEVERLMAGTKADMVFTDPPYGVAYEGGHNDKKRQQIQNDALDGEDLTSLFHEALITAVTVTTDCAAFYVWFASGKSVETFAAFAQLPLKLRAVIQWYKVRSGLGAFMSQYIPNCEPCIYAYKAGCSPQWFGPTDEKTVWELQKESCNDFHPTQKPVALPERAINNSSKKGQLVLDLFGGSGSTLIACEKTGRQARLMELDPIYCDVIVKRWQDFTGKTATLEATGEPFPPDQPEAA